MYNFKKEVINMQKIKINLKNCYGIKKLEFEFNFSQKSTYLIYAPNGTMKTSFAKTFKDLSQNQETKDLVFTTRDTIRNIKDESGNNLESNKVFVIEPYDKGFKTKKLSTLLVNKTLKNKYDEIHFGIDEKKNLLIEKLSKASGLKKDIDIVFSKDFTTYPNEFYKALLRVKNEVLDDTEPDFSDIIYNKIFSDKAIAFLQTKDFKEKIKEYIEKYNELIEASIYFKKGVFNHNNASIIARNLKDNGFFKANHSVILNATNDKKQINTEKELEDIIEQEKENIINDPNLSKVFEEIDKKLKANKELRDFRDYLLNNLKILSELNNIDGLKQKIWISYLKINKDMYFDLEGEYTKGKKEIEEIISQAKNETTKWMSVIDEFNKKFSVPFKLKIENQEDVILKSEAPNIKFEFIDQADKCDIEENQLVNILSNGERRALYILNIIFEVEARIEEKQETIFVIDDIADSFDYKNKYAIIEYLKDMSNNSLFKQIILTHNFDFYRTVSSRFNMNRNQKLHVIKINDEIILKEEKYQNNPFIYWKQHLNNLEMFIASIPFVRNIAEYMGDDNNFNKLTSLLHIKNDTNNIKIIDIENIYKDVLQDQGNLILQNQNDSIFLKIFESAEKIILDTSTILELEKKIVLAMAIRLKAEQFMIFKIDNEDFVNSITKNQTFKLYEKYTELFSENKSIIKLLNQVNLMTPENIHINSFMYEPILDMDNLYLKKLYNDIKNLESEL